MGWAGGSDIFATIIASSKKYIKDKKARKKFYLNVMAAFDSHDWDTQEECRGLDPVFDELLDERNVADEVEVYEDGED